MMLQSSIVVIAMVLGLQPVTPVTQGAPGSPARTQPSVKPASATSEALVDKLLGFFREAARTGMVGFDPSYHAFSEMFAMAKQSLAEKRIEQRFFDRYVRLLRTAALSIIPINAGLLLPVTRPPIADFVRDVTGSTLEGGPADFEKISDALTIEALSLRNLRR